MSAHQPTAKPSLSVAEKLERRLQRMKAAERKKFLSENIVRLEKNGDISYESVRTYRGAIDPHEPPAQARGSAAESPSTGAPAANFYPQTPASAQNGQQFDSAAPSSNAVADPPASTELLATQQVTDANVAGNLMTNTSPDSAISIHEPDSTGQKVADDDDAAADPLEELLARALARPRRGRPAAFDEHNKGKLVALLSLGMSLRQAASVLGVSHGTIRNTLKADPALAEEITAARFQAQLQPLACIIREARRSWKAATWLLKYLDAKIASHEETPDERRERQQRESEEFLARASGPNIKTRHVLG